MDIDRDPLWARNLAEFRRDALYNRAKARGYGHGVLLIHPGWDRDVHWEIGSSGIPYITGSTE